MSEALPQGIFRRADRPGLWARARIAGTLHVARLQGVHVHQAVSERAAWLAGLKKQQAKEKKAQALAADVSAMTWDEAVLLWLKSSAIRPSAKKRYRTSLYAVSPKLNGLKVAQVDRALIVSVIHWRREVVSNATINRDLTAISQVLEVAANAGAIEINHAKLIDRSVTSKEVREPEPLPDDSDTRRVMADVSPSLSDLIRFYAETGCRLLEGTSVALEDLHLDEGYIDLPFTKSKKRTIDLHPDTVTWIRTLPRATGKAKLPMKSKTGKERVGTPLFWHGTADKPKPYRNVSTHISKVTARLKKRAAKEGWPFQGFNVHGLRHRFACRQIEAGADLTLLSRHLGHGDTSVTERSYLQRVDLKKRQKALVGQTGLPVTTLPFPPEPVSP